MHVQRGTKILAAAFAALLLVIGVSAFAEWRTARGTQDRISELNNAHMKDDDVLDGIRSNIYLIGILTRDSLLDQSTDSADQYVPQFRTIRADTEKRFTILETAIRDDQQTVALAQLRDEFRAYADVTETIVAWTLNEKRSRGSEILRQRLRRREELFRLTGQVEELVTANFERQRNQITKADREFRISSGSITLIALLLGLSISGLALIRMGTLEKDSKSAAFTLRSLSGQLRTTQEQERKYLARELHDQVGQMLTAIRLDLSSIARGLAESNGTLHLQIARAKANVEQTLRVIRNIAMLLRPSMLDDLGLTPALSWLVKEVSRSSGMDIQADIDPDADSLPEAHGTCLYRVVQEALTNASRYSEARRVQVTLRKGPEWITATIADDGRGFVVPSVGSKGLGLLGMEERVRELGGKIEIETSPGRGTRIHIRLPRPKEESTSDAESVNRGRSRDRSRRIETAT